MSAPIHQNSSPTAKSLSPIQLQVLDLLLAGSTITEAAEKAHIHRTTIHHWCRAHHTFIAAFNAARERRLLDVNDELRWLSGPALEALRQALTADKPVAPARLRAALAVLKAIQQDAPRLPYTASQQAALDYVVDEFHENKQAHEAATGTTRHTGPKIGRNERCHCGSGIKYKRCCGTGTSSVTPAQNMAAAA